MAECSSCGRPIRWVVIAKSGKKMPVDAVQVLDGNIAPLGTTDGASGLPLVQYVTQDSKPAFDSLAPPAVPRYKSHFATCPHAASHRTGARV